MTLASMSIHRVDEGREDVYLASVDDQEGVMAVSGDFIRRTVLRDQVAPGHFWLIDEWRDEEAMRLALAMARTIASVAGLVEEPVERMADADEIARGLAETSGPGFCMVGEGWLKEPCLVEYQDTVRRQADRVREEPGFVRRLLLTDRRDPLHRWVIDEWASERHAYDSFQGNPITEGEALRFMALFAERGTPLFATTIHGAREIRT